MGLLKDLHTAWARLVDGREASPRHTVFTHSLPVFPLPGRGPLPADLPEVAIVTPCKNAARDLETYFALVDALDYPKDKLHLRMLEGDSTDDTFSQAQAMLDQRNGRYASTELIKLDLNVDLGAGGRSRISVQRSRRSAIAACRNRLLRAAMETRCAFVLFIDVDMAVIPPDTLKRALEWNAPILMANCLTHDGARVFDRNAFFYTRPVSDRSARRYVRDGIYQPPGGFFRHYPEPDSPHEIEPLHAVGGTFLLIRRDVVAAGADFPEEPYQLHLETEGFALKAADLGFGSFMPPRLVVRHGPH
jgi:glycosyltransferase involved in cell wall biosynthesis